MHHMSNMLHLTCAAFASMHCFHNLVFSVQKLHSSKSARMHYADATNNTVEVCYC